MRILFLRSPMRLAGLLISVAAVVTPFWLWNGTRVVISAHRVYEPDRVNARECTFTIRVHRFRPITEFKFSTDSYSRFARDGYVRGAFKVNKINRIEWFSKRRAVLIDLDVKLGSVGTSEPWSILYDFERGCLIEPVRTESLKLSCRKLPPASVQGRQCSIQPVFVQINSTEILFKPSSGG